MTLRKTRLLKRISLSGNMSYIEEIFSLKNKTAVVTGGLGVLGMEYVKALARAGAKVVVFDIKKISLNHELQNFTKQYPLKFLKVDITKRREVEVALNEIVKIWGTPSVLINNAALDFPPAKKKVMFEDYALDDWNAVLAVNLTGMLICCQVIGGAMAKNSGGSIINISSTYGLVSPDQRIYKNFIKPISYSVTKSGVLNLTRYLATYWGNKRVRVNSLSPGGVFNNQDKEFIKKYNYRAPLGRMARRDEYNGAILFLASDVSSYMTGANLVVDGGWTAW